MTFVNRRALGERATLSTNDRSAPRMSSRSCGNGWLRHASSSEPGSTSITNWRGASRPSSILRNPPSQAARSSSVAAAKPMAPVEIAMAPVAAFQSGSGLRVSIRKRLDRSESFTDLETRLAPHLLGRTPASYAAHATCGQDEHGAIDGPVVGRPVPRHRPQAAMQPAQTTIAAVPPRTGGGAHVRGPSGQSGHERDDQVGQSRRASIRTSACPPGRRQGECARTCEQAMQRVPERAS